MNPVANAHLIGWMLVAVGAFQAVPVLVALRAGEAVEPWLWSGLAALALGSSIAASARTGGGRAAWRLQARDGFFLAGLGWPLASLFGALPFALSETLGPLDAFLEAVAGFTTTDATALHVDDAPRSILIWRALMQWMGGAAVLVFGVAVLPLLPTGGMQVFRTELPTGARRLAPRVRTTVRTLGALYLFLTAAAALAFVFIGDMSAFDAICHAFSSLSTGGHSTRTESLGAFGAASRDVAVVCMLLGGTSFVVVMRSLTARSLRPFWQDGEFLAYVAVVAGGIALLAVGGAGSFDDAVFQAVSAVTTTGFHTRDVDAWSGFAQLVVLQLMVIGAMAGSTCGGLKSLRLLLGWRALRTAIGRLLHPHAVRSVKYAGRSLSEGAVGGVWAFFTAYALVVFGVAALLAANGYEARAALGASVAAVGNAGLSLGGSASADVHALSSGAKWALCAAMLVGRLEVMTVLVLLSPAFWRR